MEWDDCSSFFRKSCWRCEDIMSCTAVMSANQLIMSTDELIMSTSRPSSREGTVFVFCPGLTLVSLSICLSSSGMLAFVGLSLCQRGS